MVHVVSMLEVPTRLGSNSFQSNDVSGAQKSEFLFWKKDRLLILSTGTHEFTSSKSIQYGSNFFMHMKRN